MEEHTIQLSPSTYRLLLKQSARLNTTPEQLIEQLLVSEATDPLADDVPMPIDDAEAAAAFRRLTTLFADVKIEGLEEMLNDPMIQLINVDLDEWPWSER